MSETIGIFDSGLGGLTVYMELKKRFASSSFVYLADSKRSPYGTKSEDSIQSIAYSCVEFLDSLECSKIVIACHTASVVAYDFLSKKFPHRIFPMHLTTLDHLCHLPKNCRLLIIGTDSTVRNGYYQNNLKSVRPDIAIQAVGCPLLVDYIQNQLNDADLMHEILDRYTADFFDYDFVLLACTHFPIKRRAIASFFTPKTVILDPAVWIPSLIRTRTDDELPSDRFYATSKTTAFDHFASDLLRVKVRSKLVAFPD